VDSVVIKSILSPPERPNPPTTTKTQRTRPSISTKLTKSTLYKNPYLIPRHSDTSTAFSSLIPPANYTEKRASAQRARSYSSTSLLFLHRSYTQQLLTSRHLNTLPLKRSPDIRSEAESWRRRRILEGARGRGGGGGRGIIEGRLLQQVGTW